MESPEKALDAGKHERTAIARPAEAQPVFGLHASFEAAWHAPLMGRPKAFDCAPPIRLAQAQSPTTLMSALAHGSEGKRLPRTALRKGQKRRGLETCKGRSASGEADRASQRPLCPRSRRTKVCKKKVLCRFRAIKPQLRPVCKAGRFCRSRENDGRQRLALKRQPPCGGRGCGCRASWPCRRGCR